MAGRSSLLAIIPPVGKSGPLMYSIISAVLISGFFIYAMTPSTTSPKLCGGIDVAIPTAIPSAPLIRRFGTLTGSTTGSFSVSSKFGIKSTTSLSRSARYASCVTFCRRASVYRIAAAPSPSMDPKLPCPSTRGSPFLKSCAITTKAS